MVANFLRVRESTDVDELIFWLGQVREAARSFAELAERFRLAPSRSRTPSVLKHDVNSVFPVQAGVLLCDCWRRGILSVYRPRFYLPEEDEPRLRYAISWFTFIRWHLAPIFKHRFRADWQSEFATFVDQLRGQKDGPPPDFTAAVSDDAKELSVWRLDLCADVQATACAILAEELEQLLDAVEQRLGSEGGNSDAQWLRLVDAEKLSNISRGTISRAADKGEIRTNGKSGADRRLDSADFNRWHLARAMRPETTETEAQVRRKLRD